MPAMCMRFWAEWEWLKRAVDEQRYGKVRSATFRRVGSIPAGWFRDGKASGGGILDLHIHDTDFIYHLFGKPRAVFSQGYVGQSGEVDHLGAGAAPARDAEEVDGEAEDREYGAG